ncbi:MAG: MFS transporter [Deltaproteobacteria bacterium]|nr:MFS transporter [Deltaproteobacteria bacterium]
MTDDQEEAASPPQASLLESLKLLVTGSRGYFVVNLINFGDGVAYFGILTLLILYQQRDVGFSEGVAGMTVSVFTGVLTLFMLICGFLVDRVGVRRALTLALVGLVLGRLLLVVPGLTDPGGRAQAFSIAALVVMAVATGMLQPALYAGVKEYTDPRSASMGYALLYSVMNLGIVGELFVSPYLRSWWADHVEKAPSSDAAAGITGPFLFCLVITVLLLATHSLLFTKRVEERDRLVPEPEQDAEAEPEERGWFEKLRSVPVMKPRFLFFIFILLPVRTLFAHQWLTIPDYVTRCFSTEVGKHYEWLTGINPVVIVIFVPIITALTQRVHVFTMMIVGSTLTALSTVLLMTALVGRGRLVLSFSRVRGQSGAGRPGGRLHGRGHAPLVRGQVHHRLLLGDHARPLRAQGRTPVPRDHVVHLRPDRLHQPGGALARPPLAARWRPLGQGAPTLTDCTGNLPVPPS